MSVGVEPGGAHPARRQLVKNRRGVIVSRMCDYKNDRRTPRVKRFTLSCTYP